MIRTQENTLPLPIIQSKYKNTLREKQKTAIWQRTGNSAFISKQKTASLRTTESCWQKKTFHFNLLRHHSSRSLITSWITLCRPPSFWAEARMLCGKTGKRNDETEWRIYYADDALPASSPRVQILRIRSGWRFMVFFITAASLRHRSGWYLTVRRHSERRQECLVGKTGNGTMKRSEESIMLMTPYRFSSLR